MSSDATPNERPARILFCTDFSTTADQAFEEAVRAATRRDGAELVLLHVIPEPDAQFWKTYIYEVDDVDAKARRDVDAKIDESYRPRVPAGLAFRVEVRIGRVAAEILRLAEAERPALIVLGRQGHSALADLVFGAVTDKVIRAATCPVLVVPPPPEHP